MSKTYDTLEKKYGMNFLHPLINLERSLYKRECKWKVKLMWMEKTKVQSGGLNTSGSE
jgi:hypothetical protein